MDLSDGFLSVQSFGRVAPMVVKLLSIAFRRPLHMLTVAGLLCTPATADEEIFAGRPAFSWGDLPAERAATCAEVRKMAEGLPEDSEARIDLTVIGKLELVKTDGVLWYLGVCAMPNMRILCVAYQSNGMKAGDTVYIKGGYRRMGPDHAVLDPCLANVPEPGETPSNN
jgi:hypothetical protein